jgi:hypothetical protein
MKSYVNNSYWLTNRIARLPQEADLADVMVPQASGWAKDIANGTDSLKAKTNPKNTIVVPKKTPEASNGLPKTTKAPSTSATVSPATNAANAPDQKAPIRTVAADQGKVVADTSRNFLLIR